MNFSHGEEEANEEETGRREEVNLKRIAALACLTLAGLLFFAGFIAVKLALNDSPDIGIAWKVGAFLPSVVAFLVSIWLRKSATVEVDEEEGDDEW